MRVALLLPRLNHLRQLGPIAAAARRRGWQAFFVCPAGGPKDDAITNLRRVEHEGRCPAVECVGATDAVDTIWAVGRADTVVAVGLVMPDWIRRHVMPITRARGVRWVSVGYLQEELLHVLIHGPALLGEWDVATTGSWEGVDWIAEELARRRSPAAGTEARRRFVAVGYTSLDPLANMTREDCRIRHGLPPDQPILLFCPAALPHLMARWRGWVFSGPLSWAAPVLRLPTYRRVVAAVARYAERHGATIIVKTRAKNPDPPWLRHLGRIISDEAWHPHTTLELCRAADAYVGFASAMAVEATAAGLDQTHFLAWPLVAAEHPLFLGFRERFYFDGLWRAPGNLLARCYPLHVLPTWADVWADQASWPTRHSGELPTNLGALAGAVDGKASERTLDALETVT